MVTLATVEYFSQQQLFGGLQLLLQGQLVESSQQVQILQGCFVENKRRYTCELCCEPSPATGGLDGVCDCGKADCYHQAALAIEFDAQKINSHKTRRRRADTAIRLFKSEANQKFDPFPAMARHRVLYLLECRDGRYFLSVHKGYLKKSGSYQHKGPLGFDITNAIPLPKYVSQTDLYLFYQLKQLLSDEQLSQQQEQIEIALSDVLPVMFYQLLAESGRCFYQDIATKPLSFDLHYDEEFFDPSYLLPLSYHCFIEPHSHSLVVDAQQDTQINQHLLENIEIDGEWQPCLNIVKRNVDFPWLSQAMTPLDLALFSMKQGERVFDFAKLRYMAADNGPLMTQLAKYQLKLNALPLVSQLFELPVVNSIEMGARMLPGDVSEYAVLLRSLSLMGWQVEFAAKKRFVKVAADAWYVDITTPSRDWFELSLGVEIDGERINLLPLLRDLINQNHPEVYANGKQTITVELESGELLSLSGERVQRILGVLTELYDKESLNPKASLTLPRHQLTRLIQLETVLVQDNPQQSEQLKWSGATWLREQALTLGRYINQQDDVDELIAPQGLQAQLRPYQAHGVSWLQFLKQHHFSGILADDMGLGKTIQTLCSLLMDKEQGKLTSPALIIAPTSLLTNWQRETKQFCPDLTTLIWSGRGRRDNLTRLSEVDLVITSYGILAQDADELSTRHWYQVILDEAQTIKNSRSRVTKLVNSLDASHRLCLTGTPMENHLGELWSLFHFLMPGFLGNARQYQTQFKQPIEKDNCDTARRRLAQRIAPFMLRRTKAQVATELPKKTVINTLIELSQSQSDLYETIRLTVAEELQLAMLKTGAKANRIAISNALLKLRQVCCHPAMLNLAQQDDDTLQTSSKLAWLENKVPNMLEDGRNILIFSSFTTMLDLIAAQLEKQGINFEMLTGKSRHRDKIIDRFRSGEVNVFLISLKAGGAGLNLTEADVVIHVDPWWNPAAEEQASDRAYRIGQQNPVFVYKLICQNTVEERIQQLQQSKQALAQSLYQTESLSAAEMDSDDWLALLQPIVDRDNNR